MKTLLLIYNPVSGRGVIASELSFMVDCFTRAGFLVTARPTQYAGEATELASTFGAQFDRIICCGGDGTLSETAAGLLCVSNPPVLGFIPAGSTNDCAASLHLPRNLKECIRRIAQDGIPRPWDVGTLNDKSFVYVAAFGAFTSVAYDTSQDLKNTIGHLAYVFGGVAAIPSIVPHHLKLEYNDTVLEDDFYYGMVCNTISIGGIKPLSTDLIRLDDGLFEVVLVRRPTSIVDMSSSLMALARQEPLSEGAIVTFRTTRLKITAESPLRFTLDGEYGGAHQTAEIINHQHALTILHGE